ncbi:MAG TPA: hypothetical protein VKG26_05675 [Bacteroidia bacterium]|nr:hypothetical protein [Bacteroidia bacterium]
MPDLINIPTSQKASDINVPILRQPKFMALLLAYLSPTIKLQGDISNNYLGSLTYIAYNNSTSYIVGARVTSGRASYECIQANTGAPLLDTNYWYKISDDTIGLSERLNYNCQTMQLEYILNKRFNNLTSIYPPYDNPSGNIYIVSHPGTPRIAWIGRNNAISSYIKPLSANKFYYHTDAFATLNGTNYTIWVPGTLVNNIAPSNPLNYAQVVANEVNKYNAVGLTFDIQAY